MTNEFVYNLTTKALYCKFVDNGEIFGVTVETSYNNNVRKWGYGPFIKKVKEIGLLHTLINHREQHNTKYEYFVMKAPPIEVCNALIAGGYEKYLARPSDFELAAQFKYKETKYSMT